MRDIQKRLRHPDQTRYIALLIALLVLTSFIGMLAVDIYAPSLPAMQQYFHVHESVIKLTITIYFLTFGFFQLIYGPLSDAYGRKPALLSGLVIGIVGTFIAATSHSITQFFIGRAVQGIGFAASNGLVRVILRDSFKSQLFATTLSILSAMLCLGFVFGPLIGASIATSMGWQMTFYFVIVYLAIMAILHYLLLPETHDQSNRQVIHMSAVLKNYMFILKNRLFLANAFCGGAVITGILTFYMVTPFMLQHHLGLSVIVYGWTTLGFSLALIVGILLANYLLRHLKAQSIVSLGIVTMVLGGMVGAVCGYVDYFNVFSVILSFSIYGLGTGFAFSTSMICAYHPFKYALGTAGAAYVFIRMMIGFIGSIVAAYMQATSLFAVATALLIFSTIVLVIYFWLLESYQYDKVAQEHSL